MNELLTYINSLEDPTGKSIISWIIFFFWLGVANYIVHIALQWGWEWFNLYRVKNYIKINHGLGNISDNLLDRLRSAKVFLIPISFIYKRCIIYKRINDLVQIKQNGGQIDNDTLGDIHAGVSSRKGGLSNYILGVLIILGLVGTLRGLITAIVEVQPLLEDIQDPDQLSNISDALRLTLGGMSTAFVTTLAGLLASIGLGFCGWIFNFSNSAFLTRFERVVSTDVMPHFTQTPEAAIESNIGQLTKSTDDFKNTVNVMGEKLLRLSDSSWDGSLQQLYVFVNMFGEASDTLHKSSSEMAESQKGIQSTVKTFEKLTEDSMVKIDGYHAAIQSYKDSVAQSMSHLEKYQEAMHKGLVDTVESFRTYISDYQEAMSHNLENTVESFQGLVTESMTQISGYQETLRIGLENVVPDIRRECEVFKETIREYQELQTKFIGEFADTLLQRLQPITESQQTIVEEFQQVRDDLREAARGLDIRSALEKQNEVFEGLNNQIARTISQLIERQNQVFDEIKSQLIDNQNETVNMLTRLISELDIHSALEDQNKVFDRIEVHLGGQATLVAEQKEIMHTLNNNMQQLQQTFNQQGTENILNQISQKFDTLGENFGTLGNKLDTLNTTMSKPNLYRWGPVVRGWIPFIQKK